MNQRGFINNVILVIAVVVLIGISGYFAFIKRSQPATQTPPLASQQPSANQPAPNPLSVPKTGIVSDWKIFKHINFTLRYAPDMTVGSNNMGYEPNEAPDISVFVYGRNSEFNIGRNPIPASKDDSYFNPEHEDPKVVEAWDIKTLAEKIWQLNKNNSGAKNYSVTNLEKTTVAGKDGYIFSATGGYLDYQEASILQSETTYLFVADWDGNQYKIWYPSNNERSKLILQSLRFTR